MIELIVSMLAVESERTIEARFENGLIFAVIDGAADEALEVYTDTGGGVFIYRDSAQAAGIAGEDDDGIVYGRAAPDHITTVLPENAAIGLMDREPLPGCEGAEGLSVVDVDGMFGARWFADRAWRIDYSAQTLEIIPSRPPGQEEDWAGFPLHFQEPEGAPHQAWPHFPRVTAEIAGEPVELLFDTGAQGCHRLPEEDGPILWRATSFISAGLAARWREAYPEWRFIEGGDGVFEPTDMIEVGNVRLGGIDLGPVWFVVRPDTNFTDYMSQWMDEPVAGALGGNALLGRTVILDYPEKWGALSR